MRILLIHNFYSHFGGEDSIALREKELLESRGHRVMCYTRDNRDLFEQNIIKKALFPCTALYSFRTVRDMRRLWAELEPDIAYTHNVFPLISPSVFHALNRLGVPCIQNVQDFRWMCPNGLFFTHGRVCERCLHGNTSHAIWLKCFRNSVSLSAIYAAVIAAHRRAGIFNKMYFACVSDFSRRKLAEAGAAENRLFIKPNYYNGSAFTPRYGQGEYALYLGRLSEEKGIRTLLDAAAATPDVPLILAGDGPLREVVQQRLREHRLSHVHYAGFCEGEEKRKLIENALFLVIPSEWYEHFPIVILEAFAAGKPVLASRIGNLEGIIRPDITGRHFEPGNAGDISKAMRRLSEDSEARERMGREARRLIENEYSPERNAERFEEIAAVVQSRFAEARKTS